MLFRSNYEGELGPGGVLGAMNRLCGHSCDEDQDIKPKVEELDCGVPELPIPFTLEEDIKPKIEPLDSVIPPEQPNKANKTSGASPEVVDLTMEDEDNIAEAGPSRASPACESPPVLDVPSHASRKTDYTVFADDEDQADLFELLHCLNAQELDDLAKQLKLKPRSKKVAPVFTKYADGLKCLVQRDSLIDCILRHAATQSTLSFATGSKKGKERMVQTKLPFDTKKSQKSLYQSKLPFKPTPQRQHTQQERLRVMVMDRLSAF